MKSDMHPDYHPVLFHDVSNGYEFVTRSTMTSEERRTLDDGTEAYVVRLDVTANSHPFFTGEQRMVDTAGRVERFRRRYQRGADAATPADDAPAEAATTE